MNNEPLALIYQVAKHIAQKSLQADA